MRPDHGRGSGRAPAGCGATSDLGEVLEFMRLIWGVSHGLQATSKKMEAELGITGPQRLVVRIVGRCPGLAAGDLARILRLHPSTLTGVFRRLEDRGVLERRPGVRDRRLARLYLTASGRAIDRRHAGTVEAAVRRALTGLDPDRIGVAIDVLRALDAALGGKQNSESHALRSYTTAGR